MFLYLAIKNWGNSRRRPTTIYIKLRQNKLNVEKKHVSLTVNSPERRPPGVDQPNQLRYFGQTIVTILHTYISVGRGGLQPIYL